MVLMNVVLHFLRDSLTSSHEIVNTLVDQYIIVSSKTWVALVRDIATSTTTTFTVKARTGSFPNTLYRL